MSNVASLLSLFGLLITDPFSPAILVVVPGHLQINVNGNLNLRPTDITSIRKPPSHFAFVSSFELAVRLSLSSFPLALSLLSLSLSKL